MGLVTGTGLTNVSDVIDEVRITLAAEGWITSVNEGTVGSNNKKVTMHLPLAQTFTKEYNITVHMVANGDRLDMYPTYLTPTEALLTPPGSPAVRNADNRILGSPNLSYTITAPDTGATGNTNDVYPNGIVLSGTSSGTPIPTDGFSTGGNYINHWIFTPENQSPLGSTHQYMIMVVETEVGRFRTFGFGESIKLGDSGSAWTGGLWCSGSDVRPGLSIRSQYFAAGDTQYNGFGHQGEAAFILHFENANVVARPGSPLLWNPWYHLSQPWTTNWVTCAGMGPRFLGEDFVERSPANFSGQSIRVPARFYAMNGLAQVVANRMRPLCEIPDVFHTNIRDMTPGDTQLDDVERFLVVPYTAKTGTDNSGNFGMLIRNPNLPT